MNSQLNIEVAEKVLGWRRVEGREAIVASGYAKDIRGQHHELIWVDSKGDCMACEECGSMPDFSGEIESAWRVLEHMRSLGYRPLVNAQFTDYNSSSNWDDVYHCSFSMDDNYWHGYGPNR